MSAPTYLVDDLIDRMLHALTGAAGPEETLDRECRWDLQAALLTMCNEVNPHSFRQTPSTPITTTDGTSTYDLPDDFHQIIEDTVRFSASDFRTLKEIPLQMFHRYELTSNEAEGDPELYHILGKSKANGNWRIFFYPTPDTSTRVITYSYRSLPDAVWNSTRGSRQVLDYRVPPEWIPLLVSGALSVGHFSRYLNPQDLMHHQAAWAQGLVNCKKNNNPVVGKQYQRLPTGTSGLRGRFQGGVMPAWWGGQATEAT